MAQSFVTQLGKSFIRSAVNQIGRDGGKVISNQIYGDQHSTPIRIVADVETGEINIPEDVHIQKDYTILKIICAFFLAILPYLGGVILIYRGIVNCIRKSKKLYRTEQRANYVQDRRYKSGARYVGSSNVEIVVGEIEDTKFKKIFLLKGIIYLVIGIGSILLYIYVYHNMKDLPINNID